MRGTGERLLELIENQGDNLSTFSKKSKLTASVLSEMTNNKRTVGPATLEKILQVVPNLSLNWLLLGQGEMYVRINAKIEKLSIAGESKPPVIELDPVEAMFLQYLEKDSVREKLMAIVAHHGQAKEIPYHKPKRKSKNDGE